MPMIEKRDRNSWYNGIRTTDAAGGPLRPFSPSQVKENEFQWGTETVARIPQISGRISRKNVKSEDGRRITKYVELILERNYDKKKKQTRNKRATIGIDISHIVEGLMIINDNYHKYFDREGNLIYQSQTIDPKTDNQPKNGSAPDQTTAYTEQENIVLEKTTETEDPPEPNTEPDTDTAPEPETETEAKQNSKTESQQTEEQTESVISISNEQNESSQEDRETQAELDRKKHEKDHLEFLEGMLNRYTYTIEEQAKKRPDKKLTRYQTTRINQVLKELKDFFDDTDISDYLELAEEPIKDDPDTGMTYADMEILLHAYKCTLIDYTLGRLWLK